MQDLTHREKIPTAPVSADELAESVLLLMTFGDRPDLKVCLWKPVFSTVGALKVAPLPTEL
jgi:hypothetical protein